MGIVYELRRYRLKPGGYAALSELFDRAFVSPQIELGMELPGEFADLDDPDTFVWLRSFPDMAVRRDALSAFYTGPVWRAHGDAANGAMVNSDNVLLLKRTDSDLPLTRDVVRAMASGGMVVVTTCSLAPGGAEGFAAEFEAAARPVLERAGMKIAACFVTECSPNSFPRLPIREGETVFVWLSVFASDEAYTAHRDALAVDPDWRDRVFPALNRLVWRPMETARLRLLPSAH
ncbi:NIPSNAP family protein [Pacificispira sp.]|uniref:NIPSNAP family protein n=1 Tax=Pacificispira sp. TaxID=2888761 RepID=UPI003B51B51E